MRKYLRYANFIMLGAGVLGILMMLWLFSAGTDTRGLYPARHPGWVLLWILTPLVLVAAWLLACQAGKNRNYRLNFPASGIAALGCAAGGIGLLTGGLHALGGGELLHLLTGLMGIGGGVGLLWGAFCRLKGVKSKLPVHILPCFFFALQLFVLGQAYGAEPEMCRYLYRFFATAALVPACYWLWSFEVGMGRRPACIFWCLTAAYCSLVAVADMDQWLLYGGAALWMLTALPKLQYLPKQPRPKPEPMPEPALEPETVEQKAPEKDSLAAPMPDVDAILEELLRDYHKTDNP